jgi:hypothetical protein
VHEAEIGNPTETEFQTITPFHTFHGFGFFDCLSWLRRWFGAIQMLGAFTVLRRVFRGPFVESLHRHAATNDPAGFPTGAEHFLIPGTPDLLVSYDTELPPSGTWSI